MHRILALQTLPTTKATEDDAAESGWTINNCSTYSYFYC